MFPMLIRSDLPRALAAHHAQFGDVRAARIIDAERNLILRIQKLWRGVTVRWVQFIEQIQGGGTLEGIRYRERVRRLRSASSYGSWTSIPQGQRDMINESLGGTRRASGERSLGAIKTTILVTPL